MLAGRACVEWTILAALNSRGVQEVLVSTDCPAVRACAQSMGVATVSRRPEDATDTARVDTALRHALEDWGESWDCAAMLYANVPVRPPDLIDRAVELLFESGCDSVQSYARIGKYHPWWQATLDTDGRVRPWEGVVLNHGVYRRQDLPPSFVPDGGVVLVRRSALLEPVGDGPHAFLGTDHRGIVTAEGDVVDIDSPVDLLVAEGMLKSFTTEHTESTEERCRQESG
jgi:CMP-N-acetylneuraminic acid synthetase